MMIRNICLIACLSLGTLATRAADTGFYLIASGGSPMLGKPQGGTALFLPDYGYQFTFNDIWVDKNAPISSGTFEFDVEGPNNSYWSVVVSMPTADTPTVGFYEASRWPFQSDGQGGLDFNSNGRGYNESEGWFNLLGITTEGGIITSLALDFYQRGTDYGPGLHPEEFGSIRYNSDVPLTIAEAIPEPSVGTIILAALVLGFITRNPAWH